MNIMGPWKTVTIATGTTSAEVDLGGEYSKVLVLIPTITSADVTITIAKESGGTFYPMYRLDADGAGSLEGITTSGTQTMAIVFPCGAQYIKILCSASQTAETFYVRGLNS